MKTSGCLSLINLSKQKVFVQIISEIPSLCGITKTTNCIFLHANTMGWVCFNIPTQMEIN